MLDISTLLVTFSWCSVVLVAALRWGSDGRDASSLGTWSLGLGCQTVTSILWALRGRVPDWLSIVVSNGLMMLGLMLYLAATLDFFGKPLARRWVFLPALLLAALWVVLLDNYALRIQISGPLFSVGTLAPAIAVHRLGKGSRSTAQRLLMGGCALMTATILARSARAFLDPAALSAFLKPSPMETVMWMVSNGFILATSAGFLLMHKGRAECESEEQKAKLEALKGSLEERVAQQVDEIIARSRQADLLNAELRQKVDERSQELSAVLARMARQHEDREALAEGSLLAGRFLLESPLGKGGMGVVYRALDSVTGEHVAIKVIRAGSADELDALHRFLREAQASARVGHPAVVHARHVDVADGELFIVFELVEGEALDRVLARSGRLPAARVARLGARLAEALAAAHAAGVVHRDLKPANVMLTEGDRVRLLDFGISKLRGAMQGSEGDTRQGAVMGTPAYMAPEQVLDSSSVVDRSDVYALGVMLFQMLAGQLPFHGPRSGMLARLDREPPPLADLAGGIPAGLAALVLRCMARHPEDRPSASELASALAAHAEAA